MKFVRLARLDFLPHGVDAGLLVLRIWIGLPLLLLHGWMKLCNYSQMKGKFPDPLGVGTQLSLTLAVFAEVLCALLLTVGLFTRFAALSAGITMAVAFALVHKSVLSGPASGELAFIYLGACLTLFLTGAGQYSVDAKLGASRG